MHLVVGATGLVGRAVAQQLRKRACDVRALVRGGAAHPGARSLSQAGVSIVAGDLRDPLAVAGACRGVDTIVCTATSMPAAGGDALQRVDQDGVLGLIGAAERAGVRRFVYTSFSSNIRVDSPLTLAKRSCEARLAESSVQSVILQPSFFMEIWLGPHLGFDAARAQARIYGDGKAGVSYVSALDVAAFAVSAATAPGELQDVLQIGGPEPVSQLGVVAVFERTAGRSFSLEHVPIQALEVQHQSADPLQKTFAALMMAYALGDPVAKARQTADRYGVQLTTVENYAAGLRP
ncbi:MAG: NmrA family NAD(P)-binding protein [Gammaproteobacteria bacterium]|nr:NmrA family NAD(P)-binding protein [Gammaproteobacteria bacterium]MDH4312697.1 NmrA family NAD(P)-binding protein [Gammaproteobacteria bacterium]MDH5274020.1 NmrA family NAD(P)-binding protein [Gammaproteobacteria bacterium]